MHLPRYGDQFTPPPQMDTSSQLIYCVGIINRYRKELPVLRRDISRLKSQKEKAEKELRYWRSRYIEEKKEKEKAQKDNEKLQEEIERILKTNKRYQIALFDHGNFESPGEKSKKDKGGQEGHPDTNRESHTDYTSFTRQRIFTKTCGKCGHKLTRVSSVKQKILLDIVINPTIVKLLIDSERQWCPHCQKEVNAKDFRTLPFTEYGLNTFMLIMVLRFKCHASLSNIVAVFSLCYGLQLSKSDIVSLLSQGKNYLKFKYQELLTAIRNEEVVYLDETGWLVRGRKAWMWIMTGTIGTAYYAAESRGKGIAKELYGESQALAMHDGLASYRQSIPEEKQATCWAHFLRFVHEETAFEKEGSPALSLKEELVAAYRIKENHPEYSRRELEQKLQNRLSTILRIKPENIPMSAILKRLKLQKEELVRSLAYTKDGTNNLAEQELRTMVLNEKVSFGSDSFTGMETTAILGSVIQTLSRKEKNILSDLKGYLFTGVKEKYFQYLHTTFYDSS